MNFILCLSLLFLATDKVALLIGNLNYSNHPVLMAPLMDVRELANLLQQLDFRVVSLLDLTMGEMRSAIDKFLQLLDRGVYGNTFISITVTVLTLLKLFGDFF